MPRKNTSSLEEMKHQRASGRSASSRQKVRPIVDEDDDIVVAGGTSKSGHHRFVDVSGGKRSGTSCNGAAHDTETNTKTEGKAPATTTPTAPTSSSKRSPSLATAACASSNSITKTTNSRAQNRKRGRFQTTTGGLLSSSSSLKLKRRGNEGNKFPRYSNSSTSSSSIKASARGTTKRRSQKSIDFMLEDVASSDSDVDDEDEDDDDEGEDAEESSCSSSDCSSSDDLEDDEEDYRPLTGRSNRNMFSSLPSHSDQLQASSLLSSSGQRRHHHNNNKAMTRNGKCRLRRDPSLPDFVLLMGIPGSGKSTWAIDYVTRIDKGAVVVSTDAIRLEFVGHQYDAESNHLVWDVALDRCRDNLQAGVSVVLDATNVDTALRRQFMRRLTVGRSHSSDLLYSSSLSSNPKGGGPRSFRTITTNDVSSSDSDNDDDDILRFNPLLKVFYISEQEAEQRVQSAVSAGELRAAVPVAVIRRMHQQLRCSLAYVRGVEDWIIVEE